MSEYAALEAKLGPALAANRPGSGIPHVLVALPSLSVGESLLSHYRDRLPALEHRYLLASLLLPRIESCEFVLVCCSAPSPEVIDYYLSMVPVDRREDCKARFRLLEVPDRSPRGVAAKLLDRPDLISSLRKSFAGRPAFIEPWNVTDDEVRLALALEAPIDGTAPELRRLAFKGAGRRLLVEAGVPVPLGREDVRSIDEVVEATTEIRAKHPRAAGVVIKTDDSGAGDGNVVTEFHATGDRGVRARPDELPEWYLADLARGGVVEELVAGLAFSSPSVQVDILPSGEPVVLSTHEQVLGGATGQVYTGCRFPADPAYAAQLGRHGLAVGRALAARGALGRLSVDFAAAQKESGSWDVFGLEINLRKGGTTHPYAALRHLAPGRYDIDSARWLLADGSTRCYESTDNLVDPAWHGRPAADVIGAVRNAGLGFDPVAKCGVVLHMLSCLEIDGRLGMTSFGTSPASAADLHARAVQALATS
jgi:hypothetical protein